MFKGTRLVKNLRKDPMDRADQPRTDNECSPSFLEKYDSDQVLAVSYPQDMPYGYKFMESPNPLFKSKYLYGVSGCRNISFVKSGEKSEVSEESMKDLKSMLEFKTEPSYERPYRLIADSKLCLKGNCDNVSKILRPGW